MNSNSESPDKLAFRFIGEPVEVIFNRPPTFSKTPGCPDGFVWQQETYEIVDLVSSWDDTRRRGSLATNMRPEHAARAQERGSWGVGRFYFRVQTAAELIFDIYYDRAPRSVDDRLGSWHLYRQVLQT